MFSVPTTKSKPPDSAFQKQAKSTSLSDNETIKAMCAINDKQTDQEALI